MAYYPAFNRYPPAIVDRLGRIAAAQALIDGARILPAQEDELRRSALVGTVHYSTLIEGNQLSLIEAARAADGTLDPDTRAKRELVNYVRALGLIDARFKAGTIAYSADFLRELHGITTSGLGEPGSERFAPGHEGVFRPGRAVVADAIGNVSHVAPPPAEVPKLVNDLCAYLEEKRVQGIDYPAAILAGVAHFRLADIHPFADGNGRVARLFATAVLFREGLVSRHLFSPERYYASDLPAYHAALASVHQRTNNMEHWLLYFTTGLAEELERVAARARELSDMTERITHATQLSAAQERAIAALTAGELRDISSPEYAELTGRSPASSRRDISQLVELDVLVRVGRGPSARYRLPAARRRLRAPRAARAGGPWTEERVRSEVAAFLDGRTTWPSFGEFRAAGLAAAYQAMSRHGGVARWRREFGVD